jgi:hypothetical protein
VNPARRLAAVGLIALSTFAVGCTQVPVPTGEESVSGSAAPSGSTAARAVDGGDTPRARRWIDSPVPFAYTPYVEAANAVIEAHRQRLAAERTQWWDRAEAFVAECMRQAGFEYYPSVYVPEAAATEETAQYGRSGDVLEGVPWLPATRAEVERVGYGVASVSQLRGEDQPELEYDTTAAEKTDSYLASLSASAVEAYHLALSGLDPETSEVVNPDACQTRAWAKHPEPVGPDISFLTPLNAAMMPFNTFIEINGDDMTVSHAPGSPLAGPEAVALGEDFARCAAASATTIKYRLMIGQSADPGSLFDQAVGISPDGEQFDGGGGWIDAATIPDDQRSLVGSLPEREIALLDFDCRAETDYAARLAAIRADFQAAYVAEHQAEFDAMMAQIDGFLADSG